MPQGAAAMQICAAVKRFAAVLGQPCEKKKKKKKKKNARLLQGVHAAAVRSSKRKCASLKFSFRRCDSLATLRICKLLKLTHEIQRLSLKGGCRQEYGCRRADVKYTLQLQRNQTLPTKYRLICM